MKAELQTWGEVREYVTCDCHETDLPRYGRTASGYGAAIATSYMVTYQGRTRRVYAACYGNAATLYIGKPDAWIATVENIDGRAS